jgi:hypothetical protein
MYSAEQRVFIVCEYWRMGSFKQCQRAFRNKYVEGTVLTKSYIHKLVKKLETTRSVLTRHAGGRKMCDHTVQDVKDQLLASPRKSLRRLSQETGIPYSMYQRAAKKAKLHQYCVSVDHRVASNVFGETCTVLFMVPAFSWGTSGDFGHYMVYRRSLVSSVWLHKLAKHACMGRRNPT